MKMTPNSTQIAAVSLLLAAVCAQAATPLEQMNAALTEWVGVQNSVPASSVTVVPPDARVAVQPCASTYVFDYPFVSRDSVRVRCTKPNWQLFMKVGLVSGSAPATLTPGASAPKATRSNPCSAGFKAVSKLGALPLSAEILVKILLASAAPVVIAQSARRTMS
jgi:hypothetical protein